MEEFPFSPDGLNHLQIQESKHKLLFIKFTLVSTLIPPCYLIQFYLYITLALNPATPPNVMYYYFFLAKHPNEIHKSDKYSQWWLKWHDYSWCKDINDIIYGRRVLFRPNKTPEISRYIQWVYKLSLMGSPSSKQSPPTIIGPFNS